LKYRTFTPPGSYEGGWAASSNNLLQYLQIDLGNVTVVKAIATQSHRLQVWWVTKYTLDYGNEDGNLKAYNNGQASICEQFYIVKVLWGYFRCIASDNHFCLSVSYGMMVGDKTKPKQFFCPS